MLPTVVVWAGVLLASCTGLAADERLPAPPTAAAAPPGWQVEHVAFAVGNSGKVVGGPARWAISGGMPLCTVPAEQVERPYLGRPGQRLYFSDQRRHLWVQEEAQLWPIAGADDLGEQDGPGQYASFVYTGVYGGNHSGMVAAGETVYLLDNGWLRQVQRQPDGTWVVRTVAGKGKRASLSEAATLAELGGLGKGMTMDRQGNLYFTLAGGLLRAAPDGRVTSMVTAGKAAADLAAVYAQQWPGAKAPTVALGKGEGVTLYCGPNEEIYGLGRTWPQAWKVTQQGRFVPLVGYAPKEKLFSHRWGPGDPALYEVHCPMGTGISAEGWPIFQNEIPYVPARYEPNQVVVLKRDGTWGMIPRDSKDFYVFTSGHPHFYQDGSIQCAAPAPFPSSSMWIRMRKEN